MPTTGQRPTHGLAYSDASSDVDSFDWEHDDVDSVGVWPGSGGFLVLDVDRHEGGADGFAALAEWEANHGTIDRRGELPTPRGVHVWLRKPDPEVVIGGADLAPGVNVKADRGYVIERSEPPKVIPHAPTILVEQLTAKVYAKADYPAPEPRNEPREQWDTRVIEALERYGEQQSPGSRHPTAASVAASLARYEQLGRPGATSAIEELQRRFLADKPEGAAEWARLVDGARATVAGTQSTVLADEEFLRALEERSDHDQSFWAERDVLAHIYQTARARMMAPWSVLGVVLARLSAAIPPHIVLPTFGRGGLVALNTFVGLVGPSGAGKDGAYDCGSDAVIIRDVYTAGVGSGEGLAHQYVRWDTKSQQLTQVRSSVLFRVSEVDTLAALGKHRQGSTLLPELRNGWSGGDLGHAYADQNKRLRVLAHRYRLALICGIQPERSGALINDSDAGTPQRFLWFSVLDPTAPDSEPDEPEAWRWEQPVWPEGDLVRLQTGVKLSRLPVPAEVAEQLREKRRENLRGHTDPMEGQALVVRLRVAALLAILDGRTFVDDDDWRLSGVVMAVSDDTRAACQRAIRDVQRRSNVARGVNEAERDEARSTAAAQRVARLILRDLGGVRVWVRWSVLRKQRASKDRALFDDAIELLRQAGQVEVRPVGSKGREVRRVRPGA